MTRCRSSALATKFSSFQKCSSVGKEWEMKGRARKIALDILCVYVAFARFLSRGDCSDLSKKQAYFSSSAASRSIRFSLRYYGINERKSVCIASAPYSAILYFQLFQCCSSQASSSVSSPRSKKKTARSSFASFFLFVDWLILVLAADACSDVCGLPRSIRPKMD